MRITPMDIQQQQFRIRFRGFDVQEVDSFLEVVATELKEALHENSILKDEIKRQQERIAAHEEKEKTFQTAFVSAQRVIDDMKENAQRQAKLIVTQAEFEAERLSQKAREQVIHTREEINRLNQQRIQMASRVEAFINSLSAWFAAEKAAQELPEDMMPRGKGLLTDLAVASEAQAVEEGEEIPEEAMASEGPRQAMSSINKIISEVNLGEGDSSS